MILQITQDKIRKVRNKNLYRYTIEVVNLATGNIKSRSFLSESRSKARGERSMWLRNATQGKQVTQVNI